MNKENCALKLVNEIFLYYDARSKKHQTSFTSLSHILVTHADFMTYWQPVQSIYRKANGSIKPHIHLKLHPIFFFKLLPERTIFSVTLHYWQDLQFLKLMVLKRTEFCGMEGWHILHCLRLWRGFLSSFEVPTSREQGVSEKKIKWREGCWWKGGEKRTMQTQACNVTVEASL